MFTCELDSGDGGRVVVQSLFQTVVLLRVEDVDQPISAGRRQQLQAWNKVTVTDVVTDWLPLMRDELIMSLADEQEWY